MKIKEQLEERKREEGKEKKKGLEKKEIKVSLKEDESFPGFLKSGEGSVCYQYEVRYDVFYINISEIEAHNKKFITRIYQHGIHEGSIFEISVPLQKSVLATLGGSNFVFLFLCFCFFCFLFMRFG